MVQLETRMGIMIEPIDSGLSCPPLKGGIRLRLIVETQGTGELPEVLFLSPITLPRGVARIAAPVFGVSDVIEIAPPNS